MLVVKYNLLPVCDEWMQKFWPGWSFKVSINLNFENTFWNHHFFKTNIVKGGGGGWESFHDPKKIKVSKHHYTILIDIWFLFFAIIFDITMFLESFKIQLYFLRILIYFFGNSKYILNKVVWKFRKKNEKRIDFLFFQIDPKLLNLGWIVYIRHWKP